MTTHEEYMQIVKARYEPISKTSYASSGEYAFVLKGAEQYMVEASMLTFLKSSPNATLREAFIEFNKIAPDGLAPGDDGADLFED